MSASLERRLEQIQRVLVNLASELNRGTPVIVEGRKDLRALKKLEAAGDVICAKTSGRNFLDVLREVEKRGRREVILLMDFDKRGREWTGRLAQNLERMKIKPNTVFWRELSSLAGRDVKDIEGLSTYIQTLKKKIGKNILNVKE
ncbi:MAG: toprim domain-containing protein [Candidatus Bathyarchaeota archaeon]|nr:toprim domain-containing protein [Candidatus Bathyarchaeota archaeon]